MIKLSIEEQRSGLQAIGRALARESDGKALKRDLAKNLRKVMEPIKAQVVGRLLSVSSSGHPGESMRQAIAKQTRAGVRFSGRNTGVNLIQRGKGMPRGFRYAGRAFNRPDGWTPTALGGVQVHQQATPTEWFDQPTKQSTEKARQAVTDAMEDMARRLAARG